jgi:hypothetical protein
MTFRALLIGVIGAILFGAGGRYMNTYMYSGGPGLVRGHMPVMVFGLLVFFAIIINPALGWIRKSWKFKPSEMALVLALLLGVSSIIDAGLMRYFPCVCVYPLQTERTMPGWQKAKVFSYVPHELMANDCQYSKEVVDNYITPGDPIVWPQHAWNPLAWADPNVRNKFKASVEKSWHRVPWGAWRKPLTLWGAVIGFTFMGVVGLSVLVHRQWARKERIRYPLAEIANALVLQDEDGRNTIFKNKLFWLGLIIPLFIGTLKAISLWHPDMITISLSFDFPMLKETYPKFMATVGSEYLGKLQIYPAVVGLTFLLGSDIGFSLGIACPLAVMVLFVLINLGFDMSGSHEIEGSIMAWQTFGGYLAFTLMLIYVGRRYYWQTAKEAICFVHQEETDKAAVWGARVFLLSSIGVVAALIRVGLAWHIAILAVMFMMMVYVVVARLNAEAGAFFFKPSWGIPGVFLGLYGFSALGPTGFIVVGFLYYVLLADAFECLMPFAVNGLKITSDTGIRTGKMGLVLGITVLVTLVLTIPTGLWSDYQNQAYVTAGGTSRNIYNVAERNISKLSLSGDLDKVANYTSWERLTHMRPDTRFLISVAVGFGLVLALSAIRLRYTWWPIHPLVVVMFGSFLFVGKYGWSFLLGWFIKSMITKLAGASKYMELKPLMIGVVVGDLGSGFITTCTLWIYYFVTGLQGPGWRFW